ncbi:hypothetical protein AAHB60_20225 [Pseudomonas aeruginosa]
MGGLHRDLPGCRKRCAACAQPLERRLPGRVLFADLCGRQSSWSGDRREFLGPLGDPSAPAALLGEAGLSGCTGPGSTRAWRSSVRSSWHRGGGGNRRIIRPSGLPGSCP